MARPWNRQTPAELRADAEKADTDGWRLLGGVLRRQADDKERAMSVTVRKMPVAEAKAAFNSPETVAEVARRLDVREGFVRNMLCDVSWRFGLLTAADWKRPLAEIWAGFEAEKRRGPGYAQAAE